jgi:hypothetical protein
VTPSLHLLLSVHRLLPRYLLPVHSLHLLLLELVAVRVILPFIVLILILLHHHVIPLVRNLCLRLLLLRRLVLCLILPCRL